MRYLIPAAILQSKFDVAKLPVVISDVLLFPQEHPQVKIKLVELRDGDKNRYSRKGVLQAVHNVKVMLLLKR